MIRKVLNNILLISDVSNQVLLNISYRAKKCGIPIIQGYYSNQGTVL